MALEAWVEAHCREVDQVWCDVDALDVATQAAEVLSQDPTTSNVTVSVAKEMHTSLCLTPCVRQGKGSDTAMEQHVPFRQRCEV